MVRVPCTDFSPRAKNERVLDCHLGLHTICYTLFQLTHLPLTLLLLLRFTLQKTSDEALSPLVLLQIQL